MDESGQQIGPYRLDARLGEGGQSVVWKATDLRSGAVVALKKLHASRNNIQHLGRLRREAGLLSSFSDPGLPRGIELIEGPEGPLALVMEFIDGQPLHRAIRSAPLPPSVALACFRELVRLVAVLHARGVAHRDIKHPNILVREGWDQGLPGSVVLVDLGIARGTVDFATTYTATGAVIGTCAFLAPELLMGGDRESLPSLFFGGDVYALGMVLWHLLTRAHPSGLPLEAPVAQLIARLGLGITFQPERHHVEAIEQAVPGLPRLAERCLAFRPQDRFQNAGELLAALGALRGGAGAPLSGVMPPSGRMPGLSTSELLDTLPPVDASPPAALAASEPPPRVVIRPPTPPSGPRIVITPPPEPSPPPPRVSSPPASPAARVSSPPASPAARVSSPPAADDAYAATTPASPPGAAAWAQPAYPPAPLAPLPLIPPPPAPPARSPTRTALFGVALGGILLGLLALVSLGGFVVYALATTPRFPTPGVTPLPTPPVDLPAPQPFIRTAIVTLPPTNSNGILRAGPTSQSAEIEQLPRGTQVQVLQQDPGTPWVYVRNPASNLEGYMHSNILTMQ